MVWVCIRNEGFKGKNTTHKRTDSWGTGTGRHILIKLVYTSLTSHSQQCKEVSGLDLTGRADRDSSGSDCRGASVRLRGKTFLGISGRDQIRSDPSRRSSYHMDDSLS
jgi:hypothetical protein